MRVTPIDKRRWQMILVDSHYVRVSSAEKIRSRTGAIYCTNVSLIATMDSNQVPLRPFVKSGIDGRTR
jgi:hypothetical protein